MKPTRQTQPYRKGARAPGAALDAMKKGRAVGGFNPADITRGSFLMQAAKSSSRRDRPQRRPRPQAGQRGDAHRAPGSYTNPKVFDPGMVVAPESLPHRRGVRRA